MITGLNIQAILGGNIMNKMIHFIISARRNYNFIFEKGIGASAGFLLTAIFSNEQIVYFISSFIFIICLISTMTSVKEKPLTKDYESEENINGKIQIIMIKTLDLSFDFTFNF
jgi:hypothetical protein